MAMPLERAYRVPATDTMSEPRSEQITVTPALRVDAHCGKPAEHAAACPDIGHSGFNSGCEAGEGDCLRHYVPPQVTEMSRASSFLSEMEAPFTLYSIGSPSGAVRTASTTAPGTNPNASSRWRIGPLAGTITTRQVPGGTTRSSVITRSTGEAPTSFNSVFSMQEYHQFGMDNGYPNNVRVPVRLSNNIRLFALIRNSRAEN